MIHTVLKCMTTRRVVTLYLQKSCLFFHTSFTSLCIYSCNICAMCRLERKPSSVAFSHQYRMKTHLCCVCLPVCGVTGLAISQLPGWLSFCHRWRTSPCWSKTHTHRFLFDMCHISPDISVLYARVASFVVFQKTVSDLRDRRVCPKQ